MITSEGLTMDMAVGGVACEIIPRGLISVPSCRLSASCQRSISRGVKYMVLFKANLWLAQEYHGRCKGSSKATDAHLRGLPGWV